MKQLNTHVSINMLFSRCTAHFEIQYLRNSSVTIRVPAILNLKSLYSCRFLPQYDRLFKPWHVDPHVRDLITILKYSKIKSTILVTRLLDSVREVFHWNFFNSAPMYSKFF